MAASRGGQLIKRKKARRRYGCLTGRTTIQKKKGPQAAWLPHGKDNHRTAHTGQNCIAAGTPINGPRGATLPVMEEQDVRIASLGGHPSMARGGGGGGAKYLSWRSRCEKCITLRTPINGPQGAKMACNGGAKHVTGRRGSIIGKLG